MQFDFYDIITILSAYLIGNISPAIILGKINGIDIKKEGSGNAGTTNALRVLGKKAAVITLVVDILKGVVAVKFGMMLGYETGIWCALAEFCGHIWPCLYRFKGGKGVATAFGAILSVNWLLALTALAIVACGLLISKKRILSSWNVSWRQLFLSNTVQTSSDFSRAKSRRWEFLKQKTGRISRQNEL